MNKKDYIKFLLPLVAVVVIVESVVLLVGLEKRQTGVKEISEGRVSTKVLEKVVEVETEPVLALSFATETRRMEVGNVYQVEVNATGLQAVSLDSVELYVSYDPEVFAVDNLAFSSDLPKPVFSKVSDKQKVVVVNYLVMKDGGFEIDEGEVVSLLSFEVEPLESGGFDLGFATGEGGQDSVTMFIESKTGEVLPFSISKLNIKGKVRAVEAVGFFILFPAVGTYDQGSDFSVLLGANSGGEAVVGIDVVGSFDATKLELTGISKIDTANVYQFMSYSESLVTIDNAAGTFAVTLTPVGSIYEGQAVDEVFLRLSFKAKAAGVASVNFTCNAGAVTESNIINQNALDVVECASNQSGSYTINASGGDDGGGDTVETPTPTTSTSGGDELPQTGSVAQTLGMVVFGVVSVLGALMLKWL